MAVLLLAFLLTFAAFSASRADEAEVAVQDAGATIVLNVSSDVRRGQHTAGLGGPRYAQHEFRMRPGHYYRVRLTSPDRIAVSICNQPEHNSFSCYGRLDNWTVTSWDVLGDRQVYLTVKGANGRGRYQLVVEENVITTEWYSEWSRRNALLKALPGAVFQGDGGTLLSFVNVGGQTELRIADTGGHFHRSAPLRDIASGVGTGRFVFTGSEWDASNVKTFNVASMVGSDSIATYYDWGFGDSMRLLPSGDLQVTRVASETPQNYFTLRRLPPAEASVALANYAAARQAQFRAAEQRRADRDALVAQLFSGAMTVATSVVQAQAEADAQEAELNRLRVLAEEETANRRAAEEARRREAQGSPPGVSGSDGRGSQATDRAEGEQQDRARRAEEEAERRQQSARERDADAQRQADARRQEQERQRAAAEAERSRVIEFKEAVVLCELTGPQAQFGNWRCEGPLQMNYVNLGEGNYASAFAQMDCSSFRELPRAGAYRAFGCGYGLHPTNPGAGRNVPEMLGVIVGGRNTYRCPRNIGGVCRSQ